MQSSHSVNKIVINKKLSQDTAHTLYLFMAVSSLYIVWVREGPSDRDVMLYLLF